MVIKPVNKGKKKDQKDAGPVTFYKTKFPKEGQVVGVITERYGGARMNVKCFDGKNRVCRIPGRMKRRLWIRENDYVLVEPWEYGSDEKGDVIHKYTPKDINFLMKKEVITIDDQDDFTF